LGKVTELDKLAYSDTGSRVGSSGLVGKGIIPAAKEGQTAKGCIDDLWSLEYMEGEKQVCL